MHSEVSGPPRAGGVIGLPATTIGTPGPARWQLARRALPPLPFTAPEMGEGTRPGNRARILIVEDEVLVASENRDILGEAGYDVVGIAADASRAFALAESERPDIVLMDVRLARGSDGIDAARAIREQFDIPSVIVTAYDDDDTRRRAAVARPLGWLTKPFSDHQLVEAVRSALAGRD